jgi:1,4-dihydroxy-2-naphthoate octaprenyltransferase
MKIGPWISASRLRTLPLAASGILLGAAQDRGVPMNVLTLMLGLLTAFLLQILSNWANDLGDFENGADQVRLAGPSRAVQSGSITAHQMKRGVFSIAWVTLICGILFLYQSLWLNNRYSDFWIFLSFGLIGIIAAYAYTAGPKPYGYIGLGDLSVFVFFGLMSVLGMHYILYSSIDQNAFLLSVFMGTMSVGVLHLNNMRDIDDDAKAGKITVALRLGWRKSKWYLFALFALGFGSLIYFMFPITKASIALVAIPLLFMLSIRKIQEPAKLDPFLKKLALVVFFNAIFVFILTRV